MTLHRFVQLALRAIAMIALVAATLTPGVAAHAAPVSSATAPGGSAPEVTAPDTDGDVGSDPAPAPAGEADAVTAEPSASVAAAVTDAFDDQSQVPVLIRLREQADLEALALAADHAAARAESATARSSTEAHDRAEQERRIEVAEGLQAVADGSDHAEIRSVLKDAEAEGKAEAVQEYWIVNGFAATVDEGHGR